VYRRTDSAMLAGVCAGMARYFSVDVRWIRLAALLLGPSHWTGLIAYALLALLLPSEATSGASLPEAIQRNLVAARQEIPQWLKGLAPSLSEQPGVLPVAPERLVAVGLLTMLFGTLFLAERLQLLGPFRLQYLDIAFLLLAGLIALQHGVRSMRTGGET